MKYLPLDAVGTGRVGYQQQVKEANIKRIFDLVRSGKCKSRAELVRMMQLSATSVSVLVEELAERRLITETGPTYTAQPGRRPISLRLNSDERQIPVFTLQREGVRYALMNLECRAIESRFFPLDAASLPEDDAGDAYGALIEEALRRSRRFSKRKTLAVGICFPGTYMRSDRVFMNQSALGLCFSEDAMLRLRDRLSLPLYLFSGVKSLAYAEKKLLDAANPGGPETQDMVFVEIQDRISCALIAHGSIYTGPYNIAGEFGHMTIAYDGSPCICGNRGCLERYVNQSAILEDARAACAEAGLEPPATLEELGRRYPAEPVLEAVVMDSARLLAAGLYSILCSSGMRRIALGGGIEALGEPFLREIRRALLTRKLLIRQLDLNYAQAGPDAESVGLAQYFLDKVYTITT